MLKNDAETNLFYLVFLPVRVLLYLLILKLLSPPFRVQNFLEQIRTGLIILWIIVRSGLAIKPKKRVCFSFQLMQDLCFCILKLPRVSATDSMSCVPYKQQFSWHLPRSACARRQCTVSMHSVRSVTGLKSGISL